MTVDLRLGDWRDVLADVAADVLICDPPYGERTHRGHNAGVERAPDGAGYQRPIAYQHWTPENVHAFVRAWSPRVRGWFCAFSCSDLSPIWREAFERVGRYAFAPIPCVAFGSGVRLAGDGPASWTTYLNVARPRSSEFSHWGALPGAYRVVRETDRHIGGKALGLMEAIVRDYSKPGDLVVDPCAGFGTTLIAAARNGRRSVGAEIDPTTHAKAIKRLAAPTQIALGGIA